MRLGGVRWLLGLLFPPRCAACGKLLPVSATKADTPFCSACAAGWSRALSKQCDSCFQPFENCHCTASVLEKQGIRRFVKLSPYSEEPSLSVPRLTVLGIKRQCTRSTFSFLAASLRLTTLAAVRAADLERQRQGKPPLDTVISYLPRSGRNLKKYGFDQAKTLAKELAKETGYPVKVLLKRRGDGEEQKTLTRAERQKNLKGALLATAPLPPNTRVLLVDDVVTTGSSMAAAAAVLSAEEVIAVSIAHTREKRTQKK